MPSANRRGTNYKSALGSFIGRGSRISGPSNSGFTIAAPVARVLGLEVGNFSVINFGVRCCN